MCILCTHFSAKFVDLIEPTSSLNILMIVAIQLAKRESGEVRPIIP